MIEELINLILLFLNAILLLFIVELFKILELFILFIEELSKLFSFFLFRLFLVLKFSKVLLKETFGLFFLEIFISISLLVLAGISFFFRLSFLSFNLLLSLFSFESNFKKELFLKLFLSIDCVVLCLTFISFLLGDN